MPTPAVSFTHPDKVYFPSGFTKGEMIRYYLAIAPFMLPHLRGRPVTLIRFPDGVKGEKFYEKNAPGHAPKWVRTHHVPRRHHEGYINYILVNDVRTLAWCANLGAIELHPFLHRAKSLQTPTAVAFDLDPGEGADLINCIEVARLLKDLCAKLGLEAYPKVSGSKGLQVYVPLNTPITYETTTPFANSVAELLAKEHPDLVVSNMLKTLRKGRVLIDWSQNSEAKTTVCAYSLRGKHDEPFVSMPVSWQELERAAKRQDPDALFFSPAEALRRVKRTGDRFAPVLTQKQKLPKEFLRSAAPSKTRRPLASYAAKRNFARTPEPPAEEPRRSRQGSTRRFVIQKHAATHLHYDFRLELGATLKSWAVPKGLPYELGVKRSAFQVEDHPIEYLDFEGTIPKGQYGGGTVMVWDIGTYDLIDGSWSGGNLKFRLNGRKLKGEWHMFRIRSEAGKPVWLIAKAGSPMKPLSARREDQSVLTKRSMAQIARDNDAQWQSNRAGGHDPVPTSPPAKEMPAPRARPPPKHAPPAFVEPMKPLLVAALPTGPQWSYEIKWDGFRAELLKHGDSVQLLSRSGKSLAREFPGVVAAGRSVRADSCAIDGEIVAVGPDGRPSFQSLQNRATTPAEIVFYAFDLLAIEGEDVRRKPWSERRRRLTAVLAGSALRESAPLKGSAAAVLAAVKKLGLEGVVAKQSGSPYVAGERSNAWQKVRLRQGQEFVIGGYRPGMEPFESVLVGYYEGDRLMFAGKVRPGFRAASRAAVWALIHGDEIGACPFANLPDADRKGRWGEGITPAEMKTLRWVKPRHVVQIEFAEWTSGGHLRHAAFAGMRPEKKPREVRRETPVRA